MKKILVLAPRFPYPVVGGDKLRIYSICKLLSRKYSLTLFSLCETKSEMSYVLPNDDVFSSVKRVYHPKWKSLMNVILSIFSKTPLQVAYYRSSEFKTLVREGVYEHDIALAHLVRIGDYIINSDIRKVLEMTDSISMNYDRIKNIARYDSFKNFVFSIEQKRLKKYEQKALELFDCSVLISQKDVDYLCAEGDLATRKKILVCSNGVDLDKFPYQYFPAGRELVFIGNMNTVQNFDAAMWFAANVLPELNRAGPSYVFKVVGKISPQNRSALRKLPHVEVLGFVDSMSQAVEGALAGICSMRLGAGVQNKILEYMALGMPVITTSLGNEGIDAIDGEELLVANTVEEFVLKIEVLNDASYAKTISGAGRKFVENNNDWSEVLMSYVAMVDRVGGK